MQDFDYVNRLIRLKPLAGWIDSSWGGWLIEILATLTDFNPIWSTYHYFFLLLLQHGPPEHATGLPRALTEVDLLSIAKPCFATAVWPSCS